MNKKIYYYLVRFTETLLPFLCFQFFKQVIFLDTDSTNSDSSSPIIEEIDDAHQSDNLSFENEEDEKKSSGKFINQKF